MGADFVPFVCRSCNFSGTTSRASPCALPVSHPPSLTLHLLVRSLWTSDLDAVNPEAEAEKAEAEPQPEA
jgi:hypothetical protein